MKANNSTHTQALISAAIEADMQAYVDLLSNPFYSNPELGNNVSQDRIEIGAYEFGGGAFCIENDQGLFASTADDNVRVISNLTEVDAIIHFTDEGFDDPELVHIGVTAGPGLFNGKEFTCLYHLESQGLPQCFYDAYTYMVENNIYPRESALAVFGAYIHQLIVPIDGPAYMSEEERAETEVERQMAYYFATKALVEHDLNYSIQHRKVTA